MFRWKYRVTARSRLLSAALLFSVSLFLFAPATLHAEDTQGKETQGQANAGPQACSDQVESFPACGISNADKHQADVLYKQAAKLARSQQFDQALDKLKAARAISPQDTIYATAEQAMRTKVAASQLRLGDLALQHGDAISALVAYRRAVEMDPANGYAAQRLHDALPPDPGPDAQAAAAATMGELKLTPTPGQQSFEFRGASMPALEKFAALFGITAVADPQFTSRNVRIKLDNVDWETGSAILQKVCKVLIVPTASRQVLIADDTDANRRDLTEFTLRTFYVPGGTSPQQFTDLSTALRTFFDLRYINPNPASGAIVIRASQPTLDAVARFLDDLQQDPPEVMIQIQVYEVSAAFAHEIGVDMPDQFTVFNVPSEVQKLVSSSTYSQILAALESSGTSVNATTILGALLASSSSPLGQPFATFGGGLTLTGVGLAASSLHFSGTNSVVRTLDDMLLRSEHGSAATMKLGERYPIVTTQYSATNAATSLLSSLGINTSSVTPTIASIPSPQFSYEDLGLVLKATPRVQGKLVLLDYELTLRAIGTTEATGPPLLTNRELKGVIGTQDGKPVIIAGLVSKGEAVSLNGIPFLSGIPIFGRAFSIQTNEDTTDDLLIIVTPHLTTARADHGLIYLPVPMNTPK